MKKILITLLSFIPFSIFAQTYFSLDSALKYKDEALVLYLINQRLEKLDPSIEKLSSLESLNLDFNHLKTIDLDFSQLKNLKSLSISGNPEISVNQLFMQAAKIDSLKSLNSSNCDLMFVANYIGDCTNLENLNLSYNDIEMLPIKFNSLQNLTSLNLSNNDLDTLPDLKSLNKLTFLDISNNEDLDVRFANLPYSVQELNLTGVDNIDFSNSENLSLKKLNLSNWESEHFPLHYPKSLEELDITSSNFDIAKLNLLITQNNFKKLSIGNEECPFIPEIVKNNELEELTIYAPKLTLLSSKLENLKDLKVLDVQKTNISRDEFIKLKKALPNCNIIANPTIVGVPLVLENTKPQNRKVNAPFSNFKPKTFTQVVNVAKGSDFSLESGTKIIIPADAFVDKNGQIVTGDVDFKYKEYMNPLDIYLSGIPMEYDSNGVSYLFQSAGMMEIEAYKNGEKVYPNPKSLVKVFIKKITNKNDFPFYEFNHSNGSWNNAHNNTNAKRNEQNTNSNINNSSNVPVQINNVNFSMRDIYPNVRGKKPETKYKEVYAVIAKEKNLKSFEISVELSNFVDSLESNYYNFNEISAYKDVKWLYVGDNMERDYKRVKDSLKIHQTDKKKRRKLNKLINCSIRPNKAKDYMEMKFVFSNDSIIIPVVPSESGKTPASIKKKLGMKMMKHDKLLEISNRHNRRINEAMDAWLKGVDLKLEEEKNKKKKADSADAYAGALYKDIASRNFEAKNFGLSNYDQIYHQLYTKKEELIVKALDNNGNQVKIQNIALLGAFDGNLVLNFPTPSIKLLDNINFAVLVKINEKTLGYLSTDEFKKALSTRSKANMVELKLNVIEVGTLSSKELLNNLKI